MSALILTCLTLPSAQLTSMEVRPHQIHTRRVDARNPQALGSELVLLDGRAIAGAEMDSRLLDSSGSIDVLRRGALGWSTSSRVYPASPSIAELMGDRALDATDDLIVAGAPYFGLLNLQPPLGRVHVFRRQGARWESEGVLIAPDWMSLGFRAFGHSVAAYSGTEVLVGGVNSDPQYLGDGALYVFRRSVTGDWSVTQKVEPAGVYSGVRLGLGRNIACSGNQAVSIAGHLWGQSECRIAFLERDGQGVWAISDSLSFAVNGIDSVISTVALAGDIAAVGDSSAQCTGGSIRRGRVHVFRRFAGGWSHIQTLFARDPFVSTNNTNACAASDRFGWSVALDGQRLAVGAGNAIVNQEFEGAAEVFEFNGTVFERSHFLRLDEPNGDHQFGCAIDIDGDTVAVGMRTYSNGQAGILWPGGVAFFDLPRGATECSGAVNTTGATADLTMHGTASLAIGDVYGRVSGLPVGATCLPLVGSVTANVPGAGGSQGTLCLGGQLGRFDGAIGFANAEGRFQFDVDTSVLPLSAGIRAIAAGETWRFQVWYRDAAPGGQPGSNFSSAVAADFVD